VRLRTHGPTASKTTTFGSTQRVALQLLIVVAVAFGFAACGTEEPTEYSSDNQEAFMAACVDGPVDGIYQQRVCRCVYDEAEATIAFERFLEINEQLTDIENPGLPEDFLDVVATCVIEEGDL